MRERCRFIAIRSAPARDPRRCARTNCGRRKDYCGCASIDWEAGCAAAVPAYFFEAVREPRDFVSLDLQEVGVLGGFHACRQLSELGGQQRAAVFIERFFVEDQPVDIGDFLAVFVRVEDYDLERFLCPCPFPCWRDGSYGRAR